ncbi:MAG: multicopper oxidase family protein [Bryobacteraceae bacterium]
MNRRQFVERLAWGGSAGLLGAQPLSKPDLSLRIAPLRLELAPRKTVSTIAYNGIAPGPLFRVPEGKSVTVEVTNNTKIPELVHWHGLHIPPEVDGSMEEGTPPVAPGRSRRYTFTAKPSGTRWYHTHAMAQRNLSRSTYTGQFGLFYIEPKREPGRFDQEIFLALHGWDPYFGTMNGMQDALEVMYKSYSINSRMLGHGEPIRVKPGQKVLLRIVNANATLGHRLALPGHKFTVLALDGNPVPSPKTVDVLDLAPAERVDALVSMDAPGVWILGDTDDDVRGDGLGIVVEYTDRTGAPVWTPPPKSVWDYLQFGGEAKEPDPDVELLPLVFRHKFMGARWVDNWTVNGKPYPKNDPLYVRTGRRYRLRFDNQSDEPHPVHLHRHSFELVRFAGRPTSGLVKDVVVVPARSQVDADFVADNPGPTLFHCHQQLHMDFGFMAMIQYADDPVRRAAPPPHQMD